MTSFVRQTRSKPAVPLLIPAVLIAATSTSILSTDLYTPSLPHLQEIFDASADRVQLTMSLNLAGFALAQLFYGPLSDRVGRRPVLLIGMIGFCLASIGCAFATSVDVLIVARVFQGMTSCAEAVVGYAVIRELYDEAGAVRVLGAYGMAVALAPAVGPVLGGYMHVWFGWRSNFILLIGLIVVVTFLIWRFLPETLEEPNPDAIRPGRLIAGYASLLRDGPFMTYVLISGIVLGGLFALVTAFPFVFIERMNVPTQQYGYYSAAIVLAYFIGSFMANRAAGRFSSDQLLGCGLVLCALGGLLLAALVNAGQETPLRITGTQLLFGTGLGLVMATAPVRAFDVCRAGNGYAAAMLGAIEMSCGALGALLVGILHDGTAWPVTIALAGSGLGAAGFYFAQRPWRFRR